jgi:type VI secretion system secreted protein Hcp
MAVDLFLKLDDIEGESIDAAHGREIELLTWHWALKQRGSAHRGVGAGTGKVQIADLVFTKYTDRATPNLVKMCCSGRHFRNARLTVRKAGGVPLDYLVVQLTDGIVSSVHFGEERCDERMIETVTLNFAAFNFDYTLQNADGSRGATVPASWNIVTNSPR